MKVVYKYPLYPGTPSQVALPQGAEILYVGTQNDGPVLWALIDTASPVDTQDFYVYGTGHPISEEGLVHVGSCQGPPFKYLGQGLVWHVFRKVES